MNLPPCMILAAGFGTRMRELTRTRPKPLIEVAGRPLLEHALEQARVAGSCRVAVNGHYKAQMLREYLSPSPDVTFVEEQPEILDSAGGVRNALPHLPGEALFTLNSDAVWTGSNALSQLWQAWQPERMDMLLLMVPQRRAVGREAGGDFAMQMDGQLVPDKSALVWTGAQLVKRDCYEGYPPGPFSHWQLWRAAMAKGRMFGVIHDGSWADVGHPEGIDLAEEMVRNDV